MTLGNAAAAGLRFIVWCLDCRHQIEPDSAEAAERYGPETAVPDWKTRLVFGACGSRRVDTYIQSAEHLDMGGMESPQTNELDENLVKTAIAGLDWCALKHHFDAIYRARDQITQVCGHVRRCTDFIYKYPRKALEARWTLLFDQLRADAATALARRPRTRSPPRPTSSLT